jgi:hypothetical protein
MEVRVCSAANEQKSLLALLLTKADGDLVAEWCERQSQFYQGIVCLDGSDPCDAKAAFPDLGERFIHLH